MAGSKKRSADDENHEAPSADSRATKKAKTSAPPLKTQQPQKGPKVTTGTTTLAESPSEGSKSPGDAEGTSSEGHNGSNKTSSQCAGPSKSTRQIDGAKPSRKATSKRKQCRKVEEDKTYKIRKLVPRRPFPTVPTSVSATGPRSAHKEGKNYICVTRRTELGAYLRRCKDLVIKDGHKSIHLHAMGAAITHLARLTVSLPSILPFAPDEIHTEVKTGTAEVQDEIIPNNEEEDISLRKRDKSTMSVLIRIGDGDEEDGKKLSNEKGGKKRQRADKPHLPKVNTGKSRNPKQVVFTEAEQEDSDMLD